MSAELISLGRDPVAVAGTVQRFSELVNRFEGIIAKKLSIPNPKISKIDIELASWTKQYPNALPNEIIEKIVSLVSLYGNESVDNGTMSLLISALKNSPQGTLDELKSTICFGLEIEDISELGVELGVYLLEILRNQKV